MKRAEEGVNKFKKTREVLSERSQSSDIVDMCNGLISLQQFDTMLPTMYIL